MLIILSHKMHCKHVHTQARKGMIEAKYAYEAQEASPATLKTISCYCTAHAHTYCLKPESYLLLQYYMQQSIYFGFILLSMKTA